MAPRGSEGHVGLAILEGEGWAERRARPPARRHAGRQPVLEPEHLRAGVELEAELGDDRRALQPAAARRCRNHVAPAVDDVDMTSVAARLAIGEDKGFAVAAHRRLANAGTPACRAHRFAATRPRPPRAP